MKYGPACCMNLKIASRKGRETDCAIYFIILLAGFLLGPFDRLRRNRGRERSYITSSEKYQFLVHPFPTPLKLSLGVRSKIFYPKPNSHLFHAVIYERSQTERLRWGEEKGSGVGVESNQHANDLLLSLSIIFGFYCTLFFNGVLVLASYPAPVFGVSGERGRRIGFRGEFDLSHQIRHKPPPVSPPTLIFVPSYLVVGVL